MVKTLQRINAWLDRLAFWLTAISAALFFSIIVVAVIARAVKIPIHAYEEFSNLFFVWACFGGAALCYRRRQHIQFLYFVEKLPAGLHEYFRMTCEILVLVFLAVVCRVSIVMIDLLKVTHMPISQLSQVWVYLPVPFFFAIMFFYALEFVFAPQPVASERG